jgi:hypothetical protein
MSDKFNLRVDKLNGEDAAFTGTVNANAFVGDGSGLTAACVPW